MKKCLFIMEMIIGQEDGLNINMTLILCLTGNNFSGRFLDSLLEFQKWCYDNYIYLIINRKESCNIYYVRNMCLGGNSVEGENQLPWQGKFKYDYILWIDNDIIFTVNDFIKLYKMNAKIASGLYKMQDGINYATVKDWDEDFFIKNGSFEFLNDSFLSKLPTIFNADYTGFGFILIKYGVFEKLKYPWFRPLWKTFGSVTEFTMEDVSFCHLMKDLNIEVKINKEVIVKHEKKVLL